MELSVSLGNLGKILSGLLSFEDQRPTANTVCPGPSEMNQCFLSKIIQRSLKKGKNLFSAKFNYLFPKHFCPMWRDSQEIWRSEALRGTDWHHYIFALLTGWNYLGAATSQDIHLSQSEVCLKEHRSLCGTPLWHTVKFICMWSP